MDQDKEVQRAHGLADQAEASRVDGLQRWLIDQSRVIYERLDSLGAAPAAYVAQLTKPSGLRQMISGPWDS